MPKLKFRPITWADAGPLYVWRTDPETAKWSFTPSPTWDQHLRWLCRELADWPDRTFVGITKLGMPVCMIALNEGEINIMVHPQLRRQGYAKQAIEWAQSREDRLLAKVLIGNTAGLKLFASCGFDIVDTELDYVIMQWEAK